MPPGDLKPIESVMSVVNHNSCYIFDHCVRMTDLSGYLKFGTSACTQKFLNIIPNSTSLLECLFISRTVQGYSADVQLQLQLQCVHINYSEY